MSEVETLLEIIVSFGVDFIQNPFWNGGGAVISSGTTLLLGDFGEVLKQGIPTEDVGNEDPFPCRRREVPRKFSDKSSRAPEPPCLQGFMTQEEIGG
jgi:hypothetical protein